MEIRGKVRKVRFVPELIRNTPCMHTQGFPCPLACTCKSVLKALRNDHG